MERIDDANGSIAYHPPGAWNSSASGPEWEGTSHTPTDLNTTVTYHFQGQLVGVFGTITDRATISNIYTIDDGPPSQQRPLNSLKYPHPPLYNQILFTSDLLPGGNHTLVIQSTTLGYSIDYLEVVSSPEDATGSVGSTGQRGAGGKTFPASASGIIAGATVGGITLLVLLVLGIFLHRKKMNRMRAVKPSPESEIRGFDSVSQIAHPQQHSRARGWERVMAWMNQTRSDIQRSIPASLSQSGSRRGGGPPPLPLSSAPPSPRLEPMVTGNRSSERTGWSHSSPSWIQHIYSRNQFYDSNEKARPSRTEPREERERRKHSRRREKHSRAHPEANEKVEPEIETKERRKRRRRDETREDAVPHKKDKGKGKARERVEEPPKEHGEARPPTLTLKHVVNR
ncbi:hypothetical protein AAF712_007586 [Marasmius tenuissimus]|uniref:Uncharacterized protein n=1 Tax=Marasmius tenuissimus TaxID=585030 RepID=A0ABR2ZVN9_9AGAR